MDLQKVKPGIIVKTHQYIEVDLYGVDQVYVRNRRMNAIGKVLNYAAGLGGDVWFVEHGKNDIVAYLFDEFEEVKCIPSVFGWYE